MKKLRCGVIGLGRVGKMHVENMYLLPQLDIICAADYFIEEMSDWLYSVNITSGYKNYQELLQRDDIEAVFIFYLNGYARRDRHGGSAGGEAHFL